MKDLTKGPVVKTLLLFAVPIFFGNLFQLFYSLADTRIVGFYLGEGALAAVGSTSVLSNLLIGFMNGMSLGFAVPMARFVFSVWRTRSSVCNRRHVVFVCPCPHA